MQNKQAVVVTGLGLVSPIGNYVATSWSAAKTAKSGISLIESREVEGYPCRVGGAVKGEEALLDSIFPAQKQRKTDRFIHLAVIAAHEAMRDSGLSDLFPEQRERFGVYLGNGVGGLRTISDGVLTLKESGNRAISPFLLPKAINSEGPGWISMEWDLQGPMLTVSSACASGSDAIGLAARAIRDGHADYMIAGGVEAALTPLALASFGNMKALSTWQGDPAAASRPFDRDRSGFVMAEGAGILVLERADLAKKRGAKIYCELAGYGSSSDAYHITAMHPEGRGAIAAIRMALSDARIDASQVDYINAHGTGTKMNDSGETQVLKKVFGRHVDPSQKNHIVISSTKSITGHALGGAGGIEAVLSIMALKDGVVPPTANLDNPDVECDLDYVPNTSRNANLSYVMSNSFGFGGGNAALIFKKI